VCSAFNHDQSMRDGAIASAWLNVTRDLEQPDRTEGSQSSRSFRTFTLPTGITLPSFLTRESEGTRGTLPPRSSFSFQTRASKSHATTTTHAKRQDASTTTTTTTTTAVSSSASERAARKSIVENAVTSLQAACGHDFSAVSATADTTTSTTCADAQQAVRDNIARYNNGTDLEAHGAAVNAQSQHAQDRSAALSNAIAEAQNCLAATQDPSVVAAQSALDAAKAACKSAADAITPAITAAVAAKGDGSTVSESDVKAQGASSSQLSAAAACWATVRDKRRALATAFAAVAATACPDLSVQRTCAKRADATVTVTLKNAVNESATEVDEVKAVAADFRQKVADFCATAGACTDDQRSQLDNVEVTSPADDPAAPAHNVSGLVQRVRDANCTLRIPTTTTATTTDGHTRKRQAVMMNLVINVLNNPNSRTAPVVSATVNMQPASTTTTTTTTTVVDTPSPLDSVAFSSTTPTVTGHTGDASAISISSLIASVVLIAALL